MKTDKILIIIGIVGITICAIYFLVRREGMKVTASAKLPYASATYSKHGNTYKAQVSFARNLSMVSAVHIHREMNGTIGPIIAWLGTTPEWQDEPHHIANNTNTPCCKDAPCNLIAPPGTPDIDSLASTTIDVTIPYGHVDCDADAHLADKDVYLVVHGKNFTAENKWLDIIGHAKFD